MLSTTVLEHSFFSFCVPTIAANRAINCVSCSVLLSCTFASSFTSKNIFRPVESSPYRVASDPVTIILHRHNYIILKRFSIYGEVAVALAMWNRSEESRWNNKLNVSELPDKKIPQID